MKRKTPFVGEIVQSTQGRDAGRYYVVVGVEGGYITVANGSSRPIAAPKRKNLRHVRLTATSASELGIKQPFDGSFDSSAPHALKKLSKTTNQVQSEE